MTRPLRIAVADDEPDIRDYFARILPVLGHRVVVTAGTGAELVSRCRDARPDLVITDVKMPDMDGVEAARRLHQEMAVPVILVSAHHEAFAGPLTAFLAKPIKQAELRSAIAFAMGRFEQVESIPQAGAG